LSSTTSNVAPPEGALQIGSDLRLDAKTGTLERRGVHVDRHVHVAQRARVTACLGAEEVGFLHLWTSRQHAARAPYQLCSVGGLGHERNLARIEPA
jgi:hypothetical protein